ncbi:MAG: hypothetical protein AAF555_03095 [Verrucomicrobiota bacterium]
MSAFPAWFLPVLLSWSALSAGLAIWRLWLGKGEGDRAEFWSGFWLMNGLWACLNILIVAAGLPSPPRTLEEVQSILSLNLWLDLGYLVVGLLLLTRKTRRVAGLGLAILIQGGFLLVFDLIGKASLA